MQLGPLAAQRRAADQQRRANHYCQPQSHGRVYNSMPRALLRLALLYWPLAVVAGERCLAIDGDTLVCNHRKVRLANVYAAELNQPGGYAAKRRLQVLISSGEVLLRPYGQDRYGRTLAEVYVNGRRIEQADIGPRAGRGAQWTGDRHHYLPRPLKRPVDGKP